MTLERWLVIALLICFMLAVADDINLRRHITKNDCVLIEK